MSGFVRAGLLRGFTAFLEPAFGEMFVPEARLSSRLQHPNIVSVIDFGRDPEGRLFLVMELVDGTDLQGLAETGPLPFPLISTSASRSAPGSATRMICPSRRTADAV
jgi:serine/threonine protein kinase